MNAIRLLSPEATAQIKYFYKRPMWIGFATIFILGIVPEIIAGAAYVAFNQPVLGGLIAAGLIVYIDWYLHNRKIEQAKEVYQYGDKVAIALISVDDNYGNKLNGAPQQVITIRIGTELIKIKTFSGRVVDAFSPASQQAYYYNKYPETILPESIFNRNFYDPAASAQPTQKIRSIDI